MKNIKTIAAIAITVGALLAPSAAANAGYYPAVTYKESASVSAVKHSSKNFDLKVNGTLTANNTGIAGKKVIVSVKAPGKTTYTKLGTLTTVSKGKFVKTYMKFATKVGTYSIKFTYGTINLVKSLKLK